LPSFKKNISLASILCSQQLNIYEYQMSDHITTRDFKINYPMPPNILLTISMPMHICFEVCK
jgi:hypothetical protein